MHTISKKKSRPEPIFSTDRLKYMYVKLIRLSCFRKRHILQYSFFGVQRSESSIICYNLKHEQLRSTSHRRRYGTQHESGIFMTIFLFAISYTRSCCAFVFLLLNKFSHSFVRLFTFLFLFTFVKFIPISFFYSMCDIRVIWSLCMECCW